MYWSNAASYSWRADVIAFESLAILASYIDFVFFLNESICLLASNSNLANASSYEDW
jgi:hypothetical protein